MPSDNNFHSPVLSEADNGEFRQVFTEYSASTPISSASSLQLIPEPVETSSSMDENQSVIETKVLCPVCNKKLNVSSIEAHVNTCLQRKQNDFQCLQIPSDTDDDNDDNEMGGQEVDDAVVSNGDELKSAVRNGIKECVINESDDKLTLSVRRGFSFADFTYFFKKPWNKRKWNHMYQVIFIGESGVDDGGVSREFYTGTSLFIVYTYMWIHIYIYCVCQLIFSMNTALYK